ncbi:MAG: alanyl-tRNA editing protein AlaXM [Thermoprotei archaeon]
MLHDPSNRSCHNTILLILPKFKSVYHNYFIKICSRETVNKFVKFIKHVKFNVIRRKMSSKLLYMYDSYIKEFDATVTYVNNNSIELDQTAFFPTSGGVQHDTGILISQNTIYQVIDVVKENNRVFHIINKPGLKISDKVHGVVDWNRRYKLMRMHTAAHLLSAVFYNDLHALITGNQLDVDKSRIDFSVETFDRELIMKLVEKANQLIKSDIKVKIYFMKRDDALKIPDLVKLAEAHPPDIEELRIVEIEGIDKQADGGPHVSYLNEIGNIVVLKLENKGKTNRRIYYTVQP